MPWASGAIFVLSLSTSDHRPSCGHRGHCRRRQTVLTLARRLSTCARKAAASRATAGARPAPRVVSHQRLVALSGTTAPAFGFPTRPGSLPPSLVRGGQCSGGSVSPPRGRRGCPQPLRPRASRRHFFFFFFFAVSPWAVDDLVRRGRGGPALVGCLFNRRQATHRPGGMINGEGAARLATASCWDARPPPSQPQAVLIPPTAQPAVALPPLLPYPTH